MVANKKWLAISKEIRSELIQNVYCTHCVDVVAIENFTINEDKFGLVLEGKCEKCGNEVARVIEEE
ncbi:hypothetical protein ACFQPF_12010 [Fictibacillus iocasae]|uniref:Uncharacterized protein n=1 Tax=Fictibacillus iocasae TaxID=2715437 RepID=A0ABW2NWI4_9BACL